MTEHTPRVRIFAGPNGSGKSTLKEIIPDEWLGIYINADEIEAVIKMDGYLDLNNFGISEAQCSRTFNAIKTSKRLSSENTRIKIDGSIVRVDRMADFSYLAAVIAEHARDSLICEQQSFTFETVMSHPSKVELITHAQAAGYRTYLYFVATEDPEINVARVNYRASNNGHGVPEDKIRNRYYRSLDLLLDAIRVSDRAFLFDNSRNRQDKVWFAEITCGSDIDYKTDTIPAWFKRYVLDKL